MMLRDLLPIRIHYRAEYMSLSEGMTAEQFVDAMWQRRENEKPQATKSSGKYPIVREEVPSNVFQLKPERLRRQT